MKRIQPLPEGVRSSVRSGIILYDLVRVVEELVFNSLDAGATKVSVAVGVATCSVKVADNGSGIDRDGLVLLGDRYVTSKHYNLDDLDTSIANFGFRGEALCSISDVSVLEIISKAHGMPHGYRKVMKGCKCLYLGISDDRHDVGTTVIVRDLFYNQPVRRKHMQSSPKKVLNLAKKCILRIALVHSRVSFEVLDIESQDELLTTCPSPSPLLLLSDNFGIKPASSLDELKASKGELKLFGYLSGPFGILSLKAFQYIYVNSRFICKGPIHKLLNQLAAVFLDDKTRKRCGQIEKPSRSLRCPTFILNLFCPRSHYDITFEPSKSYVEFRDWDPVLVFIQETVTHFWSKNISDDVLEYGESQRKKCRNQKWQSPVEVPVQHSDKLMEDCISLPPMKESLSSCQLSYRDACELKKRQKDAFLIRGADPAIDLYDTSLFAYGATTDKMLHSGESVSGDLYTNEDNYMLNEFSTEDSCCKKVDHFVDSKLHGPFEMKDQMTMSSRHTIGANFHESRDGADANQGFTKPFQLSCLKEMNLPDVGPSFRGEVGIKFSNADVSMQRKWVDAGEEADVGHLADIDPMFEESEPKGDAKPLWLLSRCTNQHDKIRKSKSLYDVIPFRTAGEWSDEEMYLPSHSLEHSKGSGRNRLYSTSESSSTIPNCLFEKNLDTDNFVGGVVHIDYGNSTGNDYFRDRKEKYCDFNSDADWLDIGYCDEFFQDCNYASLQGDFSKARGSKLEDSCLTNGSGGLNWLSTKASGKHRVLNSSDNVSHKPFIHLDRNKFGRIKTGNKEAQCRKREARRSNSAPPFYKCRKKFLNLSLFNIEAGKIDFVDTTSPDISNVELQTFDESHLPLKGSYADDSLCTPRNEGFEKKGQSVKSSFSNRVEDSMSKEIQDVSEFDLKWRKRCQQSVGVMKSRYAGDHDTILDVSSGVLHFAGDSLVPTSISKNCLRDAKVLQQVDKKFIPVVAGSILAIIDQHAADERIRLEELRQKVLAGEMKEITYLEAGKELVLPELGYQLLHNYVEQTRRWGWICDIYGPGSGSFAKKMNVLHRQQSSAKLVAVPCILGVNLTDTDLIEFLQQLADTDGSSTIPPSVLRILNNKACRGAIMFGDTLLPSECWLIVEELKKTSLCFQCAHGRPTTVPLVNLDILHKQINKLAVCRKGTQELWHGLRRHEISLERAACRLSSAME